MSVYIPLRFMLHFSSYTKFPAQPQLYFASSFLQHSSDASSMSVYIPLRFMLPSIHSYPKSLHNQYFVQLSCSVLAILKMSWCADISIYIKPLRSSYLDGFKGACLPNYFFGLFAPYLERACILFATPAVSSVPLTI